MAAVASRPSKWVPPRPGAIDAALAALFAAGAQLEVWVGGIPGPAGAKLAAATLTTLPLAWRTVAPLPVVIVTTSGFALAVVLGVPADDPLLPLLAPIVAIYSLGARGGARAIVAGAAAALGAYLVAFLAGADAGAEGLVMSGVAVVGAVVVGRAVRVMGFESDRLEARATELERERDERAAIAVAEERARVARELHDVIGHSISVMGVQAGAVRRLLAPEQAREREALLGVERVGRDAVEEMQRLLGFLRSDGEAIEPATPLTSRRVGDLADEMRRAGVALDLHLHGDLDDLPPGRALAAFRILQEALTNVLKHAPGAHVSATLTRTPEELRIEVVDDGGRGPTRTTAGGGGHGIVGMRERAALYGGTLEAGPRIGGGFAVVVRLPAEGP